MEIVIEEDDKALIILCSLPDVEYKMFVLTFINRKSTLRYSEVITALVNHELRKGNYLMLLVRYW